MGAMDQFKATLFRALRVGGLFGAAACAVSTGSAAWAQDNTDTTSSAEVVSDVTLTKTRDLDFGSILAPNNGRVQMSSGANPTCTTNNGLVHFGVCQTAAFEGQASPGFQLQVTVPTGRRFLLTGPGQDLRVRRVAVGGITGLQFQGRTGNVYNYTVNSADGSFAFHVGARVLIRNNQTPGIYDGTFTITAEYS